MTGAVIHPSSPDGYPIYLDEAQGLLSVSHDGSITWDQLQAIKNNIWGEEAAAVEVYPPQSKVVNAAPIRHLWRLGPRDYCPDLLGDDESADSLQSRQAVAWAEARD